MFKEWTHGFYVPLLLLLKPFLLFSGRLILWAKESPATIKPLHLKCKKENLARI